MTITSIYEKYKIPPNLQRHQLEVAAVGQYVCSLWNDSRVNTSLITKTLLLHDMGNIIKFKRPFLGELEPQAAFWEQVQQEYKAKYGDDVQAATIMIVEELGLPEVQDLLIAMRGLWDNPDAKPSIEARICEYADCCVTPEGIVGFEKRLEDLKYRYNLTEESMTIQRLRENGEIIEKKCGIDWKTISSVHFLTAMETLSTLDINL